MIDFDQIFYNKKIALVGNASSLFERTYGEDIDNNDIVCRINKGPLACNKETHGIRTDILFYGDRSTIEEVNVESTVIYVLTNLKYRYKEKTTNNLHIISQSDFVEFKNVSGYKEKGKWPSTGLSAILFMFRYKPSLISLYGFDWKETPTFYKKGIVDYRHDYKLEKELIYSYNDVIEINQ